MEETSRKTSNRDKCEIYKKKYQFFGKARTNSTDSYTVEHLTEFTTPKSTQHKKTKRNKNAVNQLILKITKKPKLKHLRLIIRDLRKENLTELLKNNNITLGSKTAAILTPKTKKIVPSISIKIPKQVLKLTPKPILETVKLNPPKKDELTLKQESESSPKSILKPSNKKVLPLKISRTQKKFVISKESPKTVRFIEPKKCDSDSKLFKKFQLKHSKLVLKRIDLELCMGTKQSIKIGDSKPKKPVFKLKIMPKSLQEKTKAIESKSIQEKSKQIEQKNMKEKTKIGKEKINVESKNFDAKTKVVKEKPKNVDLKNLAEKPKLDLKTVEKSDVKIQKLKKILPKPETKNVNEKSKNDKLNFKKVKLKKNAEPIDDEDLEMVQTSKTGKLPKYLENNELSLLVPLKTKLIKPKPIVPPKIVDPEAKTPPKPEKTPPKASPLPDESPRLKVKDFATLQDPKFKVQEKPKEIKRSTRSSGIKDIDPEPILPAIQPPAKKMKKKKEKEKEEDPFWSPFEYVEVRSIKAPATLVEEVFPLPVIPPPIPIPAVPDEDLPPLQPPQILPPVPNVMVHVEPVLEVIDPGKAKNAKRKVKYPTNRDVKRIKLSGENVTPLAIQALPETENDFQITSVWSEQPEEEEIIPDEPAGSPVPIESPVPVGRPVPVGSPVPVGCPVPVGSPISVLPEPEVSQEPKASTSKSKKKQKTKPKAKPVEQSKPKPKRRSELTEPSLILEGKRVRKVRAVNYADEEFLDAYLENEFFSEDHTNKENSEQLQKIEQEKALKTAEEEEALRLAEAEAELQQVEELKKMAESFLQDTEEETILLKKSDKKKENKPTEVEVEEDKSKDVEEDKSRDVEEDKSKDLEESTMDELPPTPSPTAFLSVSVDDTKVVQDCAVSSSSSNNNQKVDDSPEPKIPKLKLKLKKPKKKSNEKSDDKPKKHKKKKKESKFDSLLTEEVKIPKLKININKDGETKLIQVSPEPKKKVEKKPVEKKPVEKKPKEKKPVEKKSPKPMKKAPPKVKMDKFSKLLEERMKAKEEKARIIAVPAPPPPKPKTPPPPPKPKEPKPVTPETVATFLATHIKRLSELNKNCNWGGIYEQAAYHFFDTTLNYYRNYLFTFWKNNTGGIQKLVLAQLKPEQIDINVNVENLFEGLSAEEDTTNYTRAKHLEKVKPVIKPDVKPPVEKKKTEEDSPKVVFQNSPLNLSDTKPVEKEVTSVLQVPEVQKYSSLTNFYNNAQNLLSGDSLSNRSSTEEKESIVVPSYKKQDSLKFVVTNVENVPKEPEYHYKPIEPTSKINYQQRIPSPTPQTYIQDRNYRITSPVPQPYQVKQAETTYTQQQQPQRASPYQPPQQHQQPQKVTTQSVQRPHENYITYTDARNYYNYSAVVTAAATQPTQVVVDTKPKVEVPKKVTPQVTSPIANFYYDVSKTYSQLQNVRVPTPEPKPAPPPKPVEKEKPRSTEYSNVSTLTNERVEFQQPYFLNYYNTSSYLRSLESSLLTTPNLLLQTATPSTSSTELFPTEVINQHYTQPQNIQNQSYSNMDNYMINCSDSQTSILLPNEALMQNDTTQSFSEISENYSPTLLTLNPASTQDYQQQPQEQYQQWEKTQQPTPPPAAPTPKWNKKTPKAPPKEKKPRARFDDNARSIDTIQVEHNKIFTPELKFAKNYGVYIKELLRVKYPYCQPTLGNTRINKLSAAKFYVHCLDKECPVRYNCTIQHGNMDSVGLTPMEIKVYGELSPEKQNKIRMQQMDSERLLVE